MGHKADRPSERDYGGGHDVRPAIAAWLALKLLVERIEFGGDSVARIAGGARDTADGKIFLAGHVSSKGRRNRLPHADGPTVREQENALSL